MAKEKNIEERVKFLEEVIRLSIQYLYYESSEGGKKNSVLSSTRQVQVEVTNVASSGTAEADKNGQVFRYKFYDQTGTVDLGNRSLGSEYAVNTNVSGWVKK